MQDERNNIYKIKIQSKAICKMRREREKKTKIKMRFQHASNQNEVAYDEIKSKKRGYRAEITSDEIKKKKDESE